MRSNTSFNLCLPNMTLAAANRAQLIGLAKPSDLGLPTLSHFYFLAIIFGIFTLSIPVKLRPVVTESRPISLQELVQMLIEAVRKYPTAYTRASALEIERDLAKARTFSQVRKSFGN